MLKAYKTDISRLRVLSYSAVGLSARSWGGSEIFFQKFKDFKSPSLPTATGKANSSLYVLRGRIRRAKEEISQEQTVGCEESSPSATEESPLNFFKLNGLNVVEATDPCALCQIAPDHSFAILEYRNSADTSIALALDGITMEADDSGTNGGTTSLTGLHIRRPNDYIIDAVVDDPRVSFRLFAPVCASERLLGFYKRRGSPAGEEKS
ncbi:hypothetical protein V8F20_005411 [Naviculisporaceae sp. PSN 640]